MTTPTHDTNPREPAALRRASPVALSFGAAALLGLALVLGNAVVSRASVRADLTDQGLYTLSDASRRVVGALTDEMRIRVFWGKELPSSAMPVKRRLEGLLDEYAAAGQGRLDVEWVEMDEAGRREAGEKGIVEGEFQVFEGNTMSAARAYNGIAVLYEDRVETVGPLTEVTEDTSTYQIAGNLEYEITSALYKVSRVRKSVVGVVSDAPPMNFMNPQAGDRYGVLGQYLEKVYGNDLRRSVSLDSPVAADVSVLLVVAPRDWTDVKTWNLEQFLLRGGKVLLLLDGADVRVAWGGQPPVRSGLDEWLKSFGVEALPGVVAEFDPESMSGAVTQGGRLVGYPYWPRIRRAAMDQTCPGTRGADAVPLYWASEISVDAEVQKAAGRTWSVLATTSEKGWRRDSTSGLQDVEGPEGKPLGKRAVLVSLEGTFTSFWKGKPVPGAKVEEPMTPGGPGMGEEAPPEPGMTEPGTTEEPAMGEEPAMTDAPMGEPPAMAEEAPGDAAPAMDGEAPPAMDGDAAPAMGGDAGMAPEGPKGPEGAPGEPAAPAAPPGPARLDEGKGVLVILGDADTVSDDFSGVRRRDITGGATAFFNGINGFGLVPNMIDWLSGSDDLIALRARGAVSRKLAEIPPDEASKVKFWNYAVAPLAVLLAGLFVYFVRRYRS